MSNPKFLSSFENYMVIKSLDLPSEKFYEKLNHDDGKNLSDYSKLCNSIFNNKNKNTILRRPCTVVLKYLESFYKKSEKVNSNYVDCILLNYWIYGKIYEQYRDIPKRSHYFGELQRLWSNHIPNLLKTSSNNKCELDTLIAIQDDWWNRKELYGYCVDYDTIKGIISFYNSPCEEIYNYLKEKDALYKEYSEHCSKKDQNKCPHFFSKCKDKDPNILLHQLTCYGEMQTKEALSLKQGERPATTETESPITAVKADPSIDSQISRDGTNPVTNSGNILLGVVVTSMTSGALYKFTPLGRMLRNGLGFNRNSINVHNNELFDYASGPFNPYSGGEKHYIGYQPA
ncbi:unnamed protein product [Plasmodium vivax]|uniref:(malaria parasite P. vivax) hypothetical protein n=1 Tax=Plasmodium vivax TaxID=5855 RepID=A0A8S4HG77_PLAVI|nr:unnamed protein product [Plasmodium vivax]